MFIVMVLWEDLQVSYIWKVIWLLFLLVFVCVHVFPCSVNTNTIFKLKMRTILTLKII